MIVGNRVDDNIQVRVSYRVHINRIEFKGAPIITKVKKKVRIFGKGSAGNIKFNQYPNLKNSK